MSEERYCQKNIFYLIKGVYLLFEGQPGDNLHKCSGTLILLTKYYKPWLQKNDTRHQMLAKIKRRKRNDGHEDGHGLTKSYLEKPVAYAK